MKLLILFSLLTFCHFSLASSVFIGCNEQKLACPLGEDCIWLTALGSAADIQLVKGGVGPGYELWKGSFSGFVYGQFPFEVTISQKVDLNSLKKTNYLSINLEVDDAEVIASGISRVNAKYKKNDYGIGFFCTTDLEPAPDNI